jgi:hypothetical protein
MSIFSMAISCDWHRFLQRIHQSVGVVPNLLAAIETTYGVDLVLEAFVHVHAVNAGVPEGKESRKGKKHEHFLNYTRLGNMIKNGHDD